VRPRQTGRSSLARIIRVALLAAVAASLALASPAGAITFGSADGDGHPNVGGLVAAKAYSDGTWIYCSGTLISPTVFLTAAHCAEGDRVRVTFSSAYQDGDKTYAGTWHADPAYNQSQSDPHDIAVVVLDRAVKGIAPAKLPRADSLSNLP
jgi:secreted trypsin-like serine protease